jgi:hypothetical protein
MRFVSKYGRFGVQVRPLIQEAYATGLTKTLQEPVYVLFLPGRLTPLERELAVAHWTFNGFYQEQDEVTIVQPDYRIGVFDTIEAQIEHGWSHEIREEIEAVLLDLAERFDDILLVPMVTVPPPWPRYDDYAGAPAALVRKLVDEGHNLDAVLTYEREHQNRSKVIEAIQLAIDDPAQEREEEIVG